MAYSFNDLFRLLRISMRVNGIIIGLFFGSLCLLGPSSFFLERSLAVSMWSVRLAGGLLVAFGLSQLFASTERFIERPILLSTIITNALIALVLLLSYIDGAFAVLGWPGRLLLIAVVALSLFGAVLPVRYFGAEYHG